MRWLSGAKETMLHFRGSQYLRLLVWAYLAEMYRREVRSGNTYTEYEVSPWLAQRSWFGKTQLDQSICAQATSDPGERFKQVLSGRILLLILIHRWRLIQVKVRSTPTSVGGAGSLGAGAAPDRGDRPRCVLAAARSAGPTAATGQRLPRQDRGGFARRSIQGGTTDRYSAELVL